MGASGFNKSFGKLVREDRMRMRWGEMDSLAHMNNVSYMRYFEEARIAWFNELPIEYHPKAEGPILGTITCKYLKPAIYPCDFLIKTYVGGMGSRSFKMWHELIDAENPDVSYSEAEAILVWADIGEGASRPLPEWLKLIIQDD